MPSPERGHRACPYSRVRAAPCFHARLGPVRPRTRRPWNQSSRFCRMRAVVITGASGGIGRACALRLARNGFRVFAGYRKEADAVSLADEATGELEALPIDVTDADQIASAELRGRRGAVGAGGLWGLVNNAGRPGSRARRVTADRRSSSPARGQPGRPDGGHAGASAVAAARPRAGREHDLGRRPGGYTVHGRLPRLEVRARGDLGRPAARACRGRGGRARDRARAASPLRSGIEVASMPTA